MTLLRRLAASALCAFAASAAVVADAKAGDYVVRSCKADGTLASPEAWTVATALSGSYVSSTSCSLETGMNLYANAGSYAGTSNISLNFRAPAGTTIVDFTLDYGIQYRYPKPTEEAPLFITFRYGEKDFTGAGHFTSARNNATAEYWFSTPVRGSDERWTAEPFEDPSIVRSMREFPALQDVPPSNALSVYVGCWPNTTCSFGSLVKAMINGAKVTVRDEGAPVPRLGGDLLRAGPRSGREPLDARATDASGIRRMRLIDRSAADAVIAEAAGNCRATRPKPCDDLEATWDLSSLAPGSHELQLLAVDGAGNEAASPVSRVEIMAPPRASEPPRITGSPRVGQTLLAARGSWIGTEDLVGRWERCVAGACTALPADALRYRISPTDVGSQLRYTVRARNERGDTEAHSTLTRRILRPLVAPWSIKPAAGGRAFRFGRLGRTAHATVRCVARCARRTPVRRRLTLGGWMQLTPRQIGIAAYGAEFIVEVRELGRTGRWQRYRVLRGRTRAMLRVPGCLDGAKRRKSCAGV